MSGAAGLCSHIMQETSRHSRSRCILASGAASVSQDVRSRVNISGSGCPARRYTTVPNHFSARQQHTDPLFPLGTSLVFVLRHQVFASASQDAQHTITHTHTHRLEITRPHKWYMREGGKKAFWKLCVTEIRCCSKSTFWCLSFPWCERMNLKEKSF